MKIWRLLGQYDAESTTYTAFAVSGMASPFTPDFSGRLKGLRAVVNRSAASSLINHVGIRLRCTIWKPNTIEVGAQGSGLQTAPAFMSGDDSKMDWEIDQPIQVSVPIEIEGRNITADTPVTVSVLLYGLFEVA